VKFVRISSEEEALAHLIDSLDPTEPTIVFCDKKTRVDRVSEFLMNRKIENLPFFDDAKMNAQMRHTTLSNFAEGNLPVIVCNNLGARGLSLPNCKHVI